LTKVIKEKGRDVEDVNLEGEDWQPEKSANGKIIHFKQKNGLFFKLIGKAAKGEKGWTQPFVEPVVDPEDPKKRQGIVVMFVDKKTGDMLVNAEFEMGQKSEKGISIRPTIQNSYSNIRNNGYPFSEKFVANNIVEFEARMKDMGGMVENEQIDPGRIGNYNLYGVLPVDRESIDLKDKPYHRWITQGELLEMKNAGGDLLTNQFSKTNELRLRWMIDSQPNNLTALKAPQAPHMKAA